MWLDEHLRHSHGYGVHSPFLYRIVREAMMPRRVVGCDRRLYEALVARGVGRRTAVRLQNLCNLEHLEAWSIDGATTAEAGLMIATRECSDATLEQMHKAQSHSGATLCILHEGRNRAALERCGRVVEQHSSMSAEAWAFTLLFCRKDLRKQHIII